MEEGYPQWQAPAAEKGGSSTEVSLAAFRKVEKGGCRTQDALQLCSLEVRSTVAFLHSLLVHG